MKSLNLLVLLLAGAFGLLLGSCISTDGVLSELRAETAGGSVEESSETTEVEEIEGEEAQEPGELTSLDPSVKVEQVAGRSVLWLVDARSGQKAQKLLSRPSQSLTASFSPTNDWIVVTDQAFSDLQTVHLFKKRDAISYQKVDRDSFTGVLWDQFSAELDRKLFITNYSTAFEGWVSGGKAVNLKLAALPRGGEWVEKNYRVELAGL